MEAWFGRAPDDAVLARLGLVRGLTRLYYAGVFLSAAAAALGPLGETGLSVSAALRDGALDPDSPESKLIVGKLYLAAFLTGEPPPGLT